MKGKKTGGRQKGSLNRTTEEVRKSLLKLLDDNLTNLQTDIKGLKGKALYASSNESREAIRRTAPANNRIPRKNQSKMNDQKVRSKGYYLSK
jgi:hypothetical protein